MASATNPRPSLNAGDAVDLGMGRTWPRRDLHKDPRWWADQEVPGVDDIHRHELLEHGATDIGF